MRLTHGLTTRPLLLAIASAILTGCGAPAAPLEKITARSIDDVPSGPSVAADPEAADAPLAIELYGFNSDWTRVVLLQVQLDEPASLPIEDAVAIEPGGTVRAVVRASGYLPDDSAACQFIDNPLPDAVNPCASSVVLYEEPSPAPLAGILELTSNDDVLAGTVSAFWLEDDAVFGDFSIARR